VEGTIRGRTIFAWFSGPPGGAVSAAWSTAWGPAYAFPDTPLALLDTATDPGLLVVVTKPGNEVRVRLPGADGTAGELHAVDTVEGVAVGTVPIAPRPAFLEVQVIRNGHLVHRTVPQQFDSTGDPAEGAVEGADRYVLLMSECLWQRGFEVTPHPDGSFTYEPARWDPAVEVAYDSAVRECSEQLGSE
jgi:hypothetical protein